MSAKLYRSLESLVPVRKVLDEASLVLKVCNGGFLASGAPEVLGSVAGIGAGTAAGAALIGGGAASGTAGAAALTSGLAAAGSLLGGGMMMGIAVAAAPAVAFGIAGYAGVSFWNARRLDRERRALLQEAIRKHGAVQDELRGETIRNKERADHLHALVIKLEDIIANLEEDVGAQTI